MAEVLWCLIVPWLAGGHGTRSEITHVWDGKQKEPQASEHLLPLLIWRPSLKTCAFRAELLFI